MVNNKGTTYTGRAPNARTYKIVASKPGVAGLQYIFLDGAYNAERAACDYRAMGYTNVVIREIA